MRRVCELLFVFEILRVCVFGGRGWGADMSAIECAITNLAGFSGLLRRKRNLDTGTRFNVTS